MTQAVGIFGGTFAPIHHGHLRLAIELRERLALASLRLIPAGTPPHRNAPGVSAQRRLDWVRMAVAGEAGLEVDAREVLRQGRSYTYDTLAAIRTELGDASPLVLLLGDDAANQLHTWHRWRELPALAHLVFVERPYEPPAHTPEVAMLLRDKRVFDPAALRAQPAGLFMTAAIPPLAISSTRVRGLLKAGRSVRGLVPQTVIDSFTTEDVAFLCHDEEPARD